MTLANLDVRVAKKTKEAQDICSFELVSVDGQPLPAFSAGSHIDVATPNGVTRQYSLCNDPRESHRYLIGVLRDPASRGGSVSMHESVREGDVLNISAPRNHFQLAHEARKSLLLAGGIGITPILCMAERLAITGSVFEMHYATRSAARTAFKARIDGSDFADKVRFHFDDGDEDQKLDLGALLGQAQVDTHLYVCGPKGFMDAVLSTARDAGWSEANLHYEFFSSDVRLTGDEAEFSVKLASSGRIISVPADKSVIEALAEAGVKIETSCEQGVCGTCVTRVLDGEVEHRDVFLTPEERASNAMFTPCCSRALSRLLVLDL